MDAWLHLLTPFGAVWDGPRLTDLRLPGTGPALYALTDHRLLTVVGDGAGKLLQGQLTCDVDALTAPEASLAAHCTPKGRMLASFLVSPMPGGFALRLPATNIPVGQ